MKTFIIILIILTAIIGCYYINKFIFTKENKNEKWRWVDVKLNIVISVFMPFSIILWILYAIYKIPSLPEEPPKWL